MRRRSNDKNSAKIEGPEMGTRIDRAAVGTALAQKIERMNEQRLVCECETARLQVELARVRRIKPCSAAEQRKKRNARKAKRAA